MSPDPTDAAASPFAFALNAQRTVLETGTDAAHNAAVAADRVEDIDSVEVGQTPSEVVYTENKLELLHYEAQTETQQAVPIIVVYALINRPYVLDLQPDRSVIRRLLEAGHDVYLVDWNEPSRLDQHLTLDDYVNRYIDNCVDVVRERSGQDAVNVLGYCMGGTLSVMYTSLHREKVNALGLLATGLCFDGSGGVLELWGDEAYYDPEAVTETFGNMPAEFLDVGFALMDPVANFVSKYARLYDNLENEDFVRNFARMEQWLDEGIDVAGATYVQFLEDIYQDNALCRNELTVGGRLVDVTRIDVPLVQIVGEYDHLIPPAASKPFNEAVGSDDVTTIEYPTGHIGLSVSASAHRDVWPEVAEWFHEKSGDPSLADVIAEGVEEALGVDVETDVTAGDVGELQVAIADEGHEIARAVVARDSLAVKTFLEDALDVRIRVDTGTDGIVVEVEQGDEVWTTVVPSIGEAIREEIREAVENVDFAAAIDLIDVQGIGPTYARRLQRAGIVSVEQLAASDPDSVAAAADATTTLARDWIARARDLVGDRERTVVRDSDDAGTGVQAVSGIGPTYASRLDDAGIETLSALSTASAEAVAEAADVSVALAEDWIEQAAARSVDE